MTRERAEILWNSIIAYADISQSLGDEGNSGEFSNDDEEAKLIEEFLKLEQELVHNFNKATGYFPIRTNFFDRYVRSKWKLEEC